MRTPAGTMKHAPATRSPASRLRSMADVDRQLGRVRPGDEVRRAEQVEELLVRQPLAAPDDLVLHHRDVRGGAAEGGRAQPEEEQRQFTQGCSLGAAHGCRIGPQDRAVGTVRNRGKFGAYPGPGLRRRAEEPHARESMDAALRALPLDAARAPGLGDRGLRRDRQGGRVPARGDGAQSHPRRGRRRDP